MNQELITVLLGFFPWGFMKLVVLIVLIMYLIFAAVVVRQEQLMAKVLEIPFSPVLRIAALVHFVAAFVLLLLALVLL